MKRLLSIILAITIILPTAANAAAWVTVSKWAYNDVSNFKKQGLLPESFDAVTDYTAEITRLQFAELLYEVLKQTNRIEYTGRPVYEFEDTTNEAARKLAESQIMMGEDGETKRIPTGTGTKIEFTHNFYPNRLLTREEMAAIVYRAASVWCPYLFRNDSDYNEGMAVDYYLIADWARRAVSRLRKHAIISGMPDGYFQPKLNLSIEQAISVLYRFYNTIPSVAEADGAPLYPLYQQSVQVYANGITETRKGNELFLRDGDDELMSFETDIYTNVYCATHDGIIYVVAQNIYGRSDIYNALTKELLHRIPYSVYEADEDYIITKFSQKGPMTFGLYSYDNEELLPPEYSLDELDAIKANGFNIPSEEKTEASGWIYYADNGDNNHLYKIDSNGENKQKISDRDCDNIEYVNGRIYFEDGASGEMYSINPDGGEECYIGRNIHFIDDFHNEWHTDSRCPEGYMAYAVWNSDSYIGGKRFFSRVTNKNKLYYDNEWVYITEQSRADKTMLFRMKFTDGNMIKEQLLESYEPRFIQLYDGYMYFLDFTEVRLSGTYNDLPLYRYDGKSILKIHDNVWDYGFMNGKLVMTAGDDYEDSTAYTADADGSNAQPVEEINKAREDLPENGYTYLFTESGLSDEEYTVYVANEYSDGGVQQLSTWVRNSEGNSKKLIDGYAPFKRIGNMLYFVIDNLRLEEQIAGGLDSMIYPEKDEKYSRIIACSMKTSFKMTIAYDVMSVNTLENANGVDWFTYTDHSGNIRRYNASEEQLTEVFPNKGLRKYGELQGLSLLDGGLYKADTDGNYSLITEVETYRYMYVENGVTEGIQFDIY